MAGYIADFEAGAVPRAADFAALVAVVRDLMKATGVARGERHSGRGLRMFAPAGAGAILCGADGEREAVVGEMLWQCGPHVAVLPGSVVRGVADAMAAAGGVVPVGVHGSFDVRQHEVGDGSTLECTGVEYEAAMWEPMVEEEDGSVQYTSHGEALAWCYEVAADGGGKWQQAVVMWPMPQVPCVVWREVAVPGRQGCEAVLPSATAEQVLALRVRSHAYGGGDEPMVHEWRGRLDRWGQLHFAAENYKESEAES